MRQATPITSEFAGDSPRSLGDLTHPTSTQTGEVTRLPAALRARQRPFRNNRLR